MSRVECEDGGMSLRMAALGLIAQRPGSTGYDLLRTFELSLANVWPATQSQLYAELNRICADGLIEAAATGPRGRKEYTATGAGHVVLREWLVAPTPDPLRNPLMLKVFLLTELGLDGAAQFLRGIVDDTQAELDRLVALDASVDWSHGETDRVSHTVLDWGIRYCRMQRAWAEESAAALSEPADADTSVRRPH